MIDNDKIELEAKSDRELLIMAVMKLNHVGEDVIKCKRAIWGNGKFGIKFQMVILWGLICLLGIESPIVGKVSKFFLR